MRVLYIMNSGMMGGLQMHVKCLMESLAGFAETAVAINVESDPKLVSMFEDAGLKVYRLGGRSGHDWRVIGRFRRALADFRPDVIHVHDLPFLSACWLLLHKRVPVIHSLHTPPQKPSGRGRSEWFVLNRLVDYWLPVSNSTWNEFRKWHPTAKGEVFFNSLRLSDFRHPVTARRSSPAKVVGMVGRNADQKDWPSFHKVEAIVCGRMGGKAVSFLNAGEREQCDGREAIARMDLFVMTSKHEQLPTTVLECFALGTPICGFLPAGGTSDILKFSNGPVRGAFITGRSCEKLADIVMDLLSHPEKRRALVEDGRQILENHFDAEKNCRGRLMEIYEGTKR